MAKQARKNPLNPADENFRAGEKAIASHPMFAPLARYADFWRHTNNLCPEKAWAVVTSHGEIHCHPKRRGEPEEWAYVIAHCLLHLGLEHFSLPPKENKIAWNVACDCYIAKFLYDLKIGRPPSGMGDPRELTAQPELKLYERFTERGIPKELLAFGTADNLPDMVCDGVALDWHGKPRDMQWASKLAVGISMAVTSAVNVAGGYSNSLGGADGQKTAALAARDWFVSSYPLLGAIAANFKIIEDPALCARMEISVAAINVSMREIYINPAAALTAGECKFVMAHEFLHAGLRHDERAGGRDPYLWNVACDYVINDWLAQMEIGDMPRTGLLHDKELRGLSAESVYDRVVTDIRKARKLATLRGVGLGDVLGVGANWRRCGDGLALDDFYRNSISQGLTYHEEQGRGYLPEGLIEEIRALSHPPIAWDVELAKWFDSFFSPLEKRRSYARLSRRQSATPDIPRPSWVDKEDSDDARTFGVVLDTSGSMDRALLAKALGAIASYSVSRDVPAVRVVFCDADAYDQGYMRPEDIAQTVKIKGRGGTVLQPGIDLLEGSDNFPREAPLLIITDGYCDVLRIRSREHAYLIPVYAHLPFPPKGKVFRMT
jgi:predicted metal-dependent peptidase